MKSIIFFLVITVLLSCHSQVNESKPKPKSTETNLVKNEIKEDSVFVDSNILKVNNLVDIQLINSSILVELKYATEDNFMKMKLYSRINKAYLQKDVALRLSSCQEYLSSIKPGYKLLIYDAARPVSVQQKMWDALDSLPPRERGKFVSNPTNRSLHNLGAAVDITICDEKGKPLDMGAGYDDIRKIAYPEMESFFLKSGELSKQHVENRELLRKVMRKGAFRNIQTEWWHFNACSRKEGLRIYKVLLVEP